jgi:esterase/lipase superfamily enzyme
MMSRVYFVTNRKYHGNNDPWFGVEMQDNDQLSYGFADVNNADNYKISNVTTNHPVVSSSDSVFAELQQSMKDQKRDTVIYIHGFNTDFTRSITNSARMLDYWDCATAGAYKPNIIAYSWPSDGNLFHYAEDKKDAEDSASGLAKAMKSYHDYIRNQKSAEIKKGIYLTQESKLCRQDVNLLCHSMGNYVFRFALQKFLSQNGFDESRFFGEVVLIAADEDNDALECNNKLKPLANIARRTSIYFNKEDSALAFSKTFKHDMTRLGASGPIRTNILPPMIKPIDASRVVENVDEHDYLLEEKCGRIHADLAMTLMGIPSEEIPGREYNVQAAKYVIKPLVKGRAY